MPFRFSFSESKFCADVCPSPSQTRLKSLEEIQAIFGDEVVEGVSIDTSGQVTDQDNKSEGKEARLTVEADKQ